MPITDRSQLVEGGWRQIRAALQEFEGTVLSAEWGQWGGQLIDDDGKPVPPREFLEINNSNVHVLVTDEELSMDIEGQEFSFRINCSGARGTIWDKFLESADDAKLLVPDDLVGKRIHWQKVAIAGSEPRFSTANYVIKTVVSATPQGDEIKPDRPASEDPMVIALDLAVGKTEAQFRSASALHPVLANNQILPLIKAGLVSQSFIADGKLIVVQEGNKAVYHKP